MSKLERAILMIYHVFLMIAILYVGMFIGLIIKLNQKQMLSHNINFAISFPAFYFFVYPTYVLFVKQGNESFIMKLKVLRYLFLLFPFVINNVLDYIKENEYSKKQVSKMSFNKK